MEYVKLWLHSQFVSKQTVECQDSGVMSFILAFGWSLALWQKSGASMLFFYQRCRRNSEQRRSLLCPWLSMAVFWRHAHEYAHHLASIQRCWTRARKWFKTERFKSGGGGGVTALFKESLLPPLICYFLCGGAGNYSAKMFFNSHRERQRNYK